MLQLKRLLHYTVIRAIPGFLLFMGLVAGSLMVMNPPVSASGWRWLMVFLVGLAFFVGLLFSQFLVNTLLHRFGQQLTELYPPTPPTPYSKALSTPELPALSKAVRGAVQKLQDSHVPQKYVDSIFQSMINTFIVVAPNGRIQQVNTATCKLLKYSEEELIGSPLGNILSARTFPLHDAGVVEVLASTAVRNIEAIYLAKDGQEIPIIFSSSAIVDETNKLTGIVCVGQDITGLKQTQNALQEQEKQFRLLFDEAPIGMAIISPTYEIVRVNQAYGHLLGSPKTTLLGQPFTQSIHPDDLEHVQEVIVNLTRGKIPNYQFETRFIDQVGQTIDIIMQVSLLYNRYNQPHQFIVQTVDNTERKRAELENVQITNLLRKAANVSEQVTSILSLERLLQTAVSLLQEQFHLYHITLYLLDQTGEQLIIQTGSSQAGQPTLAENYPISLDDPASLVAYSARKRVVAAVEDIQTSPFTPNPPSSQTHAEIAIPLVAHDILLGVLAIQDKHPARFKQSEQDILSTVARQVAISLQNARLFASLQSSEERLQRANEELARSARAKDEFLANMSHELRTPLMGVLGKAEVLHEGIYGRLNEQQLHAVSRIQQSGQHLLAIINNILDLARIEAGKFVLDIKRVSVTAICEEARLNVKQLVEAKSQHVLLEIDDNATVLHVDERRLRQILENLLSNASKFSPPKQPIGLKVWLDSDSHKICFDVWDRGIGIERSKLNQLFKPFTQLDVGLTRHHEGTGLGLTLVHRLVEMHQGHIQIESTPGMGSHFIVCFPHQLQTAQAMPKASGMLSINQKQGEKRPLILLIEDSEAIIETVSIYLPHNGYQLLVARDGLSGVAQAIQNQPDLILMDIKIPQLDGIKAIERIRVQKSLQKTPIIVLTGLNLREDQQACMQAGASNFLPKPFTLQKLVTVINKELHHSLMDKANHPH